MGSEMCIRDRKVRWGYLILLGILFSLEVAAFSANAQELQPERMQAIKKADNQASVNWLSLIHI